MIDTTLQRFRALLRQFVARYLWVPVYDGYRVSHWWLGRAGYDFTCNRSYYAPMPFNWIFSVVRQWYYFLRYPDPREFDKRQMELQAEAYRKGFEAAESYVRREMEREAEKRRQQIITSILDDVRALRADLVSSTD